MRKKLSPKAKRKLIRFIKLKLLGIIVCAVSIIVPYIDSGCGIFTLAMLPLGIYCIVDGRWVMI